MTFHALGDAQRAAALAKLKRELMRRWGPWCRLHHKLYDDTALRLVAQRAGVPLHLVEAFVLRLEIFASANHPRGQIAGFNVAALSAHWSLPNVDVLGRIYAQLEEIGWIEQDALATFDERNAGLNDPTATERKRNQRAREKAEEAAAAREAKAPATVYPQSRHVTRDVTPYQNREVESGESGEAAAWLATEGKRLLAEHQVANPETAIERWRRDLDNDAAALATIIKAAAATGYVAGRFHNLIVDQIKRHPVKGTTLPLPLGPMGVTKRRTENGG